jgi:hypothetical protein
MLQAKRLPLQFAQSPAQRTQGATNQLGSLGALNRGNVLCTRGFNGDRFGRPLLPILAFF